MWRWRRQKQRELIQEPMPWKHALFVSMLQDQDRNLHNNCLKLDSHLSRFCCRYPHKVGVFCRTAGCPAFLQTQHVGTRSCVFAASRRTAPHNAATSANLAYVSSTFSVAMFGPRPIMGTLFKRNFLRRTAQSCRCVGEFQPLLCLTQSNLGCSGLAPGWELRMNVPPGWVFLPYCSISQLASHAIKRIQNDDRSLLASVSWIQ